MRQRIQKLGRFLSGMVMPNIGAFIAWGFITALFIPAGWMPNEALATMVSPMITYLLPVLIGYTGGKMVGDIRGGVVGAVATMGVIAGTHIPMFLGAMIMGPVGGLAIRKFDEMIKGRVKSGFEMLVNNFSAGIIGMAVAIIANLLIGPIVTSLNSMLGAGVEAIVKAGLLPVASLLIEPAKILFLNNAINHGVLTPLGMQEVTEVGKSIFFLLEANPGPGLGILLAYWFAGKGNAKQSAPGAALIHFFGGIHEIYFPYILMKPSLLLAVIAGGAAGVFTFSITGAGLVAAAAPGSIFAVLAMTPRGNFGGIMAGVLIAAAVSFFVASAILKASKDVDDNLDNATKQMKEMKGKKQVSISTKNTGEINKIIVACDAGMGSSAMAASQVRNKVQKAGLDIEVDNSAVDEIPQDVDLVIVHKELLDRAKKSAPGKEYIPIETFLNNPVYDELVERLKAEKPKVI